MSCEVGIVEPTPADAILPIRQPAKSNERYCRRPDARYREAPKDGQSAQMRYHGLDALRSQRALIECQGGDRARCSTGGRLVAGHDGGERVRSGGAYRLTEVTLIGHHPVTLWPELMRAGAWKPKLKQKQ